MFRSIVRRRYRKAWAAMNAHDYEAILAQVASTFEIEFIGDTSLGASRRTREAMRQWFQRFFRLFSDARFELRDMAVDGWPWNTRIFGSFAIHATLLGQPHNNVFIQSCRCGGVASRTTRCTRTR